MDNLVYTRKSSISHQVESIIDVARPLERKFIVKKRIHGWKSIIYDPRGAIEDDLKSSVIDAIKM